MRRRRICFVLPSLNGGGAERAAVTVLNALDDSAWDRSMYLYKREGPYLGDLSPSVRLSSGDGVGKGRLAALRAYFSETRPDVVVAFLSYVSVLLAVRWSTAKARVVFNQQTPVSSFVQDQDYRLSRRRGFALAAGAAYRRADLVVATSRGVADDLRNRFRIDLGRVRVVHNPVDLGRVAAAATAPLDEHDAAIWRRPAIVTAGRLAEAKNFPLLIDAIALLPPDRYAHVFVLGEGAHHETIRERIVSRGLTNRVRLCGFTDNPWRYISRADVFVLTSRYEGFGNVLVEAMACGVPVVATSSPGTREIVTDGVDGLLVDRHTPEAVAAALDRVLSDGRLRSRLAAGARQTATRYALPAIVQQYETLFGELAA